MAEVTTERAVNVGQLGEEMGGVPLRAVGPDDDGVTRVWLAEGDDDAPTATDADLIAALAEHKADPDWEPADT